MNAARSRIVLIALFLTSLALSIVVIAVVYLRGGIYANHLQQLMLAVLAVYSVPLGTILGGMFGERGMRANRIAAPAFWVALTVSLLWNLLLLVRVVIFGVARDDSVEDFAGYLTTVSAASSFLVVGALAFFFTKKPQA
jgi:hypothetical protein